MPRIEPEGSGNPKVASEHLTDEQSCGRRCTRFTSPLRAPEKSPLPCSEAGGKAVVAW